MEKIYVKDLTKYIGEEINKNKSKKSTKEAFDVMIQINNIYTNSDAVDYVNDLSSKNIEITKENKQNKQFWKGLDIQLRIYFLYPLEARRPRALSNLRPFDRTYGFV